MNKIIYNLVYNRKKCLNKKGMALVRKYSANYRY